MNAKNQFMQVQNIITSQLSSSELFEVKKLADYK